MAEAMSALDLCESVEQITQTCGFVYDHAEDSDDADHIAFLLAALRDAKQAVAEVYSAVERHLLALDTPRQFEVVGLGVIERKRSVKRTEWDHDGVRSAITRFARLNGHDPLDLIWSSMRPSWRVTDLRANGIQVDEYCREEIGAESIMLPPRAIEDRGVSQHGSAA